MIESLILLLSTDWFLPYWSEIGIAIAGSKKVCVQLRCRETMDEAIDKLTGGDDSRFRLYFSLSDLPELESKFLALLRRCRAEQELSTTREEWAKLSHRELTAVFQCSMLNLDIPSADGSGVVPYLEFPIRAEAVKVWEKYAVSSDIFKDVCLNSQTEWDIRSRKLLVSPQNLVNQLWIVLLYRALHAFWSYLRERLTPQQLQGLVAWYRVMIKGTSKEDRPDLIPSFIK